MKRITAILSALCALGLNASGAQDCPAIRPDHPRIFFNAETWPELKARAEGPAAAHLKKLLSDVEALPENPVPSGTEAVTRKAGKQADGTYVSNATGIKSVKEFGTEAAMCALAWRFTGKEKYLEKTKRMLRASIDGYTAATANHRPVNWYSTSRINCICAYDWIYEALSDDERRSFIVPLAEHVRLVQPEAGYNIPRQPPGSKVTGFYGMASLLWYSGLAAYGDGFCDELAASQLSEGYAKFMEVIEFRNSTAGDDGALISPALNYSMGVYPYAHFNFFYSFLSATGRNIAADYPDMALFPYLLWWSWIRDEEQPTHFRAFGISDVRHHNNLVDHSRLYDHISNYIHFYAKCCPQAVEFTTALRKYCPSKEFSNMFPVYPFIMDEGGEAGEEMAKMVESSPLKARHFETVGQIYMRSGWTPDATYCSFTAGPVITQHKHYDDNNFIIYKYDHLALDTGDRGLQNDLNLAYYYGQSVAHNVILIHKDGEERATFWGSKTDDPKANLNYGGQVNLEGSKVIGFETNDKYTYIASDAAKSYGPKAEECVRQFVFLYPDWFVVYDRVASSEAGMEKDWLLHFKNRPEIKGNLLRADSGNGRLFCQTFLPEKRRVELIGGPGKEFWVRDRNFEINPKSIEADRKHLNGRGPYYGSWRIELKPTEVDKEARFLNVLTATSTSDSKPVKAKYIKDSGRDGVQLKIDGKTVVVMFNRSGAVGGEISIAGVKTPFTESVQPQSGILMK